MGISGPEILVILLVALIVLGPQRLPDAARQVGKAMGELRRISAGFQNEMRTAMEDTPAERSTVRTATQNVLEKELPPGDASAAADDAIRSVSDQGAPSNGHGANGHRRPRRTEPLRAAPDPDEGG